MNYIVIGFSTRKKPSLISRLIQFVERTPYSHVYSMIEAKNIDRQLVYHASEDNLHFMNYDEFKKINSVFEEHYIYCSEEERIKILQYCVDKSGRHYGKMEFVGIGYVRLVRFLTGKQVSNPLRNKEKTMVCSELVGRILMILGSDIEEKLLEIEGPKYIRNKIKELSEKRLIDRISYVNI